MAAAVVTSQSDIVARAMKDRAFRSRLVADPRATLEQMLGVALPEAMRVRIVEEAPDEICLVLPKEDPAAEDDAINLGLREVRGFASAGTYTGCGTCSVTAPETSRACGCR